MKENTIVSLADSNYFELLNELIDSIKRFEESKRLARGDPVLKWREAKA